jgi:hypothetical protein
MAGTTVYSGDSGRFHGRPGTPVALLPDTRKDYTLGNNISRDMTQDQQEKDRADEDRPHCQHINHSQWRAHQSGGTFVYLGSVVNK